MTANSSEAPKRAAIIINPAKPVDIDVRALAAKHCSANGWGEPIWMETTKEDPGVGQAKEALEQGAAVVIAAGGDGTVRCVAEVLAGGRRSPKVRVMPAHGLCLQGVSYPADSLLAARAAQARARRVPPGG